MKNLPATILAVVFSVCLSYAQDTNEAETHYKTADALYQENNYQPAIESLDKAAALFESSKNIPGIIKSQNLKGECLANLSQCDEAIAIISQSLELAGANLSADHPALADTYYYLSRAHGGCARRTAEAIALMHKSMNLKRKLYGAESLEISYDYNFMGYYFRNVEQLDSASYYLNKALAIRTRKLPADDIEISHTLYFMGRVHESRSEVEEALDLHQRAYLIRQKRFPEPNATVSNSLEAIGGVYQKIGNYNRALDYFNRSLEIRKRTLGENHSNVGNSYYQIGNLYNAIQDYHSALQYYEQGNRIVEMNLGAGSDILATYFAVTGKLYGLTGDRERGLEYVTRALSTAEKLPKDHVYRGIIYAFVGDYYDNINESSGQAEYFRNAIHIFKSAYGAGSVREADMLFKMGEVRARNNNFQDALYHYKQSLGIYEEKMGKSNPKPAAVYHAMGNVYARQGDLLQALSLYQKAFSTIAGERLDLYSNPQPDTLESKMLALRISADKIKALHRLALKRKDNHGLQPVLSTCRFAMRLIDLISLEYNNEAAKVDLEKQSREIYLQSMEVLHALYSATGEKRYLQEAFYVAENSKAVLLLANLRDSEARHTAGVPDSLVDEENDLRIAIAYYRNLRHQAMVANDKERMQHWEKKTFDAQEKLDRFTKHLRKAYPAYYDLKYKQKGVPLPDFQRILPDAQTLAVEYFVADSSIFVFVVDKENIQWYSVDKDISVLNLLDDYYRSLTDIQLIVNSRQVADSLFITSSTHLYDLLLGNVLKERLSRTEHLIIIPDDILSRLNFGTLLTTPVPHGENKYALLPYLINQCNVSHAYSAAFLEKQSSGTKRFSAGFAGFAPSYPQEQFIGIDTTSHPLTYTVMRNGNLPLPGAVEEVQVIASFMKGSSWLHEEATETNFKTHAPDFGILHLAMHSLLNDDQPEYSELLFNPAMDEVNDGFLKISEIYNMKLNAELVVLSACSSGYGKLQAGEGPISISRAFSYAGCPSVVMSLWKVPDAVTAKIMTGFYRELKNGKSKDEALRLAQLNFVQATDDPLHHHPYFWAGFVVMGDAAPLRTGLSPMLVYGSLGIIAAIAVAFAVRRRKQKRLVQAVQ